LQATRAKPQEGRPRAIPAPFLNDVFSAGIKQISPLRELADQPSEAFATGEPERSIFNKMGEAALSASPME